MQGLSPAFYLLYCATVKAIDYVKKNASDGIGRDPMHGGISLGEYHVKWHTAAKRHPKKAHVVRGNIKKRGVCNEWSTMQALE